MTVGGWIGWWLAERFGIMTAFIVSTLGSLVGVIVGWRIGREYFD
jgi:membrane protein YqaA with SNARE-associated domain